MTRQADCKRRVRTRIARTGESYAVARGRLLADYPGLVPGDSRLDWVPGALHVSTGDATVHGETTYFHRLALMAQGPQPLLHLNPPGRSIGMT